ncbi:MAG: response regulator transcription factor [Leptolyngbyaceae cyanobacterium SM2_5_2]|nr:response regulator transcription factor [Leptolyngbyaceae cyanobacterium SM2_5_2]
MKILLLEDDLPTSDFLANTLSSHHYAVDIISDGAAGLDMASRWHYDLLILDWVLPTLDGLEVCRRLRAQGSRTPILMLTVRDANDDIVAGLDAGADDYLPKSSDASQLLARVRALLRRSKGTSLPVLQWGDLHLDPALAQVTYQQTIIPCRPKEYELLELFLRNPQRLLTRSVIIDCLWPMDDAPVEGSVTNLIKDLRQRLKSAGLPVSPIETVYGLGYRLKLLAELGENAEPELDTAALAMPEASTASLQTVLEQATRRFQDSLVQRLAVLDEAVQLLQKGGLQQPQRHGAWVEAHKLAGGLGLFGCSQAEAAAEAIEILLTTSGTSDQQLAQELDQCLQELKQALAQPSHLCSKTTQP